MSRLAQQKKQILIEQVVKELLQRDDRHSRTSALAEAKKRVAIMLKDSKEQEIANRRRALTDPGLSSVKGGVTLE